MKLRDYLDREKLTATAFAARVGVTHAAIVRYMNETRRPEWAVMDRIAAETGGVVMPTDFMPNVPVDSADAEPEEPTQPATAPDKAA